MSLSAPIVLVDLAAQHAEVAAEVAEGFQRVLDKTAFILGPDVLAFEQEFAAFSGVSHCIGVANGTDALELALRGAGIGPGDEVIVPVNTFIATALAAERTGARVVLVDCDPVTQLIDPDRVESAVSPRTRAIMPVHLFGQAAPMEALLEIAERHGLLVVEDAAQAQGARQGGQPVGGFGVATGTSFYPGKNLGAYGDAGAVLTNDSALAARVRALRNYGSEVKYHHPETGFNSRLDTLQAVVLRAKLLRLAGWNEARRVAAGRYHALLETHRDAIGLPATLAGNDHVWHLYVVELERRDEVLKALNSNGIGAGIHYPVPIHRQGAFRHLGYGPGSFPVAERLADRILSLPMHPHITEAQQTRVVAELIAACRRG